MHLKFLRLAVPKIWLIFGQP